MNMLNKVVTANQSLNEQRMNGENQLQFLRAL